MKAEDILKKISPSSLPRHVAIIMDGNGRWAKKRLLPRIAGHSEGVKRVKPLVIAASDLGIKALTLYSFSAENWSRPEKEVSALMSLLDKFMVDKAITRLFFEHNIKFNIIGNIERVPEFVKTKLLNRIEETKEHKGMVLTLALSYGSRQEIIEGMKKIAASVKSGEMNIEDITEEVVDNSLMTSALPPLDLVIRTSGEYRISNFLLWQAAYAEFYFTDLLWPGFTVKAFYEAVLEYQGRNRRFGLTDEQIAPQE